MHYLPAILLSSASKAERNIRTSAVVFALLFSALVCSLSTRSSSASCSRVC